jgi:gluconate 2-dehydrogenase gamma chain
MSLAGLMIPNAMIGDADMVQIHSGYRWIDRLQVTRRALLGHLALLTGAIAVSSLWPFPARALQNPIRFDPVAPRFLTGDERAFVTAAVDRLLPADDLGPGGLAAEVPRYIDLQLAGPWGRGDDRYTAGPVKSGSATLGNQLTLSRAELYRTTIAALRLTQVGRTFEHQPPAAQDAFLTSLQQGAHDTDTVHGTLFFAALLADSVEGIMADPRYGGNAGFIGWKLIGYPGVRYDWTPYLQNAGRPLDLPIVGTFGPLDSYGLN